MAIEWGEEYGVVAWSATVTDASGIEHRVTIELDGTGFRAWYWSGGKCLYSSSCYYLDSAKSAAEAWLHHQEGTT